MKIDIWYKKVLANLATQAPELNARTGLGVYALPGVTFRTDTEVDGFPLLQLRKIPMSFVPEVMWFLSGSSNVRPFLEKHTKIWSAFAEEDGEVTCAYGKRWAKNDQLRRAVAKLKADPSTRHAVVVTWDSWEDVMVRQKNVPCPVMFTMNVINGRLNMHVVVRSNDMVLGFPTDVAGFALLQYMVAQELGVRTGVYTHSISNAHFYENQRQAVDELLKRKSPGYRVDMLLPLDSFNRAAALEDGFVDNVKSGLMGYHPLEAIKNIPIAI